MSQYEGQVLIVDAGSDTCKTGLGGCNAPQLVFPTVVCDINENNNHFHTVNSRPIQSGTIVDWDAMEKIYRYIFSIYELQPILLTELSQTPKIHREKLTTLMFEQFALPATYMSVQSLLSLYACGKTTGLVLECGHEISQAVPIVDGTVLEASLQQWQVGGRDLTLHLQERIHKGSGVKLEDDDVKFIKENVGRVWNVGEEDLCEMVCVLPDGKTLTVQDFERKLCAEPLFQPKLIGKTDMGIHNMVFNSITSSSMDYKTVLYQNIVLSGGSTMFNGFSNRLSQELERMEKARIRMDVFTPDFNRQYSSWIGGSILSSLSSFETMWITREEYNEEGPTVVHRKCL